MWRWTLRGALSKGWERGQPLVAPSDAFAGAVLYWLRRNGRQPGRLSRSEAGEHAGQLRFRIIGSRWAGLHVRSHTAVGRHAQLQRAGLAGLGGGGPLGGAVATHSDHACRMWTCHIVP